MADEGVKYFPLYCTLDEKFELIEAEFGLKGFAIVVKLFQRVYREHGYYCEWNNDIALIFAKQCGFSNVGEIGTLGCAEKSSQSGNPKNLIDLVVAASVRRGIFDEQLFSKYSILTSRGIQRNFLNIVRNRKKVEIKKEYLLLSDAEIKGNIVITNESYVRNGKSYVSSEQSKVKESKVKESKGDHIPPLSPTEGERAEKADKPKRNRFIPPTVEEVEVYCFERNNGIDAQAFVDFYCSKGWMVGKNKMKDWKAAVRTWERNRKQNGGNSRQRDNSDVNASRQSQLDYLLGKIREEEKNDRK